MIKHPQLIAVGLVFLGILSFGAGVYLLAKENLNYSAASATPPPAPVTNSISNRAKKKPTRSRKPTAEPTAAPVKRPPSSVHWIKYDSYLQGNYWKVILTSEKWFDTGIPYVANDTLNVNKYDSADIDTHTMIKVNGQAFSNKNARQIFYFDSNGYPPSIRDTVKLKLEDGAEPVELEVVVIPINSVCSDYQNHKEIHEASFAWAENMVNRTKR